MIAKLKSNNCVFCSIRTELIAGTVIGLTCFSTKCIHRPEGKIQIIDYSIFYITISTFIALLITGDCIYNSYNIHMLTSNADTLKFIELLTDVLFNIKGGVIVVCCLLTLRFTKAHNMGLITILENSKQYGFDDLLSDKLKQRLHLLCVVGLWIVFCLTLEDALYLYFSNNIAFNYIAIKLMISVICFYIDITALYQYSIKIILYRGLLRQCYEIVMDKMTRYNYKAQPPVVLTETLSGINRLHMAIIKNMSLFCKQVGVCTVIWINLTSACVVANVYALMKALSTGNSDLLSITDVYFQARLISTILLLYQKMTIIEELGNISEEILPFLYKYPISKLSKVEADQVEHLITTLSAQKPVIRVADICTEGTRLLASTSGVIVTYVLVALQFKASWMK